MFEKGNPGGFKKGYTPWNKGRKGIFHHSEETKKAIIKKQKGKHYSPETEFKKDHTINKGRIRSKDVKKNISKGRLKRKEKLGYINSPKTRKNMSKTRKRLIKEGKIKFPIKSFKKGMVPWNKGKFHSERTKRKIRKARKKQKIPLHHTKPELKFIELINKYNLPFKYTGDGRFWIENINPDFVECNGKKICIEVFGDYWHNPLKRIGLRWERTEKGRRDILAKYGWKMLVLWENELNTLSDEKILSKIKKFINSKNSISKYL